MEDTALRDFKALDIVSITILRHYPTDSFGLPWLDIKISQTSLLQKTMLLGTARILRRITRFRARRWTRFLRKYIGMRSASAQSKRYNNSNINNDYNDDDGNYNNNDNESMIMTLMMIMIMITNPIA